MNEETPNADAIPQKFKIGKWEAMPFCLNTAILLERIGSPFMQIKTDPLTGKQIPVVPTISDVAYALWVILNWHKPGTNEIIADPLKLANEVSNLSSQITMREFAAITGELNAMMSKLNDAVVDSGIEGTGEKKDGTGFSAS